jgi:hypothetical protein
VGEAADDTEAKGGGKIKGGGYGTGHTPASWVRIKTIREVVPAGVHRRRDLDLTRTNRFFICDSPAEIRLQETNDVESGAERRRVRVSMVGKPE